jgi:16S rRNA G527 N7-methylase RsmG
MEPNKNLLNLIEELQKKVTSLEDQVRELYRENLETTNTLYEISNSLESRIDILASEPYNLDKFSLNK